MRKIFGYICLALSFVAWGIIVLLPFFNISKGGLAASTTFFVITGEILFFVSASLLGKDVLNKIKSYFSRNKKNSVDSNTTVTDNDNQSNDNE